MSSPLPLFDGVDDQQQKSVSTDIESTRFDDTHGSKRPDSLTTSDEQDNDDDMVVNPILLRDQHSLPTVEEVQTEGVFAHGGCTSTSTSKKEYHNAPFQTVITFPLDNTTDKKNQELDDTENISVVSFGNGHSLPTVEQVQTDSMLYHGSASSRSSQRNLVDICLCASNTDSKNRRRMKVMIISAIAIIIVIVSLSIGLVVSSAKSESDKTNSTPSTTANDEGDGHNSSPDRDDGMPVKDRPTSTLVPTVPMPDIKNNGKFQSIVNLVTVQNSISASTDFDSMTTPQYKAALWLATEDKLYSDVVSSTTSTDGYIQRYIVAVLYYSWNGPNWFRRCSFLSTEESVCDWYDQNSSMGIFCDNKQQVNHIVLRKLSFFSFLRDCCDVLEISCISPNLIMPNSLF
jgi:hypothetical protein